jgi:hypothetical protein
LSLGPPGNHWCLSACRTYPYSTPAPDRRSPQTPPRATSSAPTDARPTLALTGRCESPYVVARQAGSSSPAIASGHVLRSGRSPHARLAPEAAVKGVRTRIFGAAVTVHPRVGALDGRVDGAWHCDGRPRSARMRRLHLDSSPWRDRDRLTPTSTPPSRERAQPSRVRRSELGRRPWRAQATSS